MRDAIEQRAAISTATLGPSCADVGDAAIARVPELVGRLYALVGELEALFGRRFHRTATWSAVSAR